MPPPARLRVTRLEDRTTPAVFTVTTVADSGAGSLRQAILDANTSSEDDEIKFDPTLTDTITLGGTELPVISGVLKITGPGAQLLKVSGNDKSRVFSVSSQGGVTISGLTITHGSAGGTADDGFGGGIESLGTLELDDCVIDHSAAAASGGGVYNGGGQLTVRQTAFTDNTARFDGGGLVAAGPVSVEGSRFLRNTAGTGGGISTRGTVSVSGSEVSANTARSGGGIYHYSGTLRLTETTLADNTATNTTDDGTGGGGLFNFATAALTRVTLSGNAAGYGGGVESIGTLTVADSTFSLNTATRDGVHSVGAGGGIANDAQSSLTVTGSTFVGNRASAGGGLSNANNDPLHPVSLTNSTFTGNTSAGSGGGIDTGGPMTLASSTVFGNTAGAAGGGVFVNGSLTVTSTIIAGNTGPGAPDLGGTTASGTNNLIGDGTGQTVLRNGSSGNRVGTAGSPIDPLLDSLANYGGPTQTMALKPGSPAIDHGANPGSGGPTTDQRGAGYVRVFNGTADIGAFEVQPGPVQIVVGPASLPDGQLGAAYSQTLTASGPAGPFTFTVTAGGLPGGLTLDPSGTLTGTPTVAGAFDFTVTATAAGGTPGSQSYHVSINSPPTISDIPDATVAANGTLGPVAFTVADAETASTNLNVTARSSDQSLVPDANIHVAAGAGGARTITVSPATGATGATTITVTVTDGGGLTASDTFQLTVSPPNTAPTISDVTDRTVAANGSTGAVPFTVGDAETPAASLSVSGHSSDQSVVPEGSIVIAAGDGGDRTVTVTPAAGATGVVTITLTVTDGGGLTAADTFQLTVSPPPNTPPGVSDIPDQTVPRDGTLGPVGFTVTDTETPATSLGVAAHSSDQSVVPDGNITVAAGSGGNRTITVTPAAGATGVATITVTVTDGGGLTATDTFRLTVSPPPPPGSPPRTLVVSGGGSAAVYTPDGAGHLAAPTALNPFPGFAGPLRAAQTDVDGDTVPDSVLVTGPGTPIRVAVISGADNRTVLVPPFDPFGGGFSGGGFVAAADLDRDGRAEFLVTPDQGGGPRVSVFALSPSGTVQTRANFYGIDDPRFRGGARAALADVNKDGTPDLVVAAGFGGGPRVALFDGTTVAGTPGRLVNDFYAFPGLDAVTLRNGVYVAAGDINGDGYADLIFGGGPGGAPRVLALSGAKLAAGDLAGARAAPLANFFVAGDNADRGGVRLAVVDADGDGRADVAAASGAGSPARVRVYPGTGFPAAGEPAGYHDTIPFGGATLTDGVYVG